MSVFIPIIWSLKDIGLAFACQQVAEDINLTLSALGSIGQESSQHKLNDATDQVLWSLNWRITE
jgi:hypothetical protein